MRIEASLFRKIRKRYIRSDSFAVLPREMRS
jgi:hypothetical protein